MHVTAGHILATSERTIPNFYKEIVQAGLRLGATDAGWGHGDGPEMTGPRTSLVLAMSGRKGAVDGLGGEGAALLATRI